MLLLQNKQFVLFLNINNKENKTTTLMCFLKFTSVSSIQLLYCLVNIEMWIQYNTTPLWLKYK